MVGFRQVGDKDSNRMQNATIGVRYNRIRVTRCRRLGHPAISFRPRKANEAWDESQYSAEVSRNPEPRSAGRSSVQQRNDGGTSAARQMSRVRAPVEVPEDIVERVRTLCLALPEVTVRVDYSLTRARSTAQSFDIRRRSFCLLVAREGPDRQARPAARVACRPR
jgi:hypothetical protein